MLYKASCNIEPLNLVIMRTLTFWIVALLFSMFCVSCSVEEEQVSEYYVQYEVKVHSGGSVSLISAKTPTGGYTVRRQLSSWTETFGPVKKGFKARLSVSGHFISASIRVSKDNGPMALKASYDNSAYGGTLEYVIE